MKCHCCSDKDFADCCQPFIVGISKPATAEELMRSRYSAYAAGEVEYLLRTTHPSTRKFHDPQQIREWAGTNRWQRLEIISLDHGTVKDKKGSVEFKAYYLDPDDRPRVHEEYSKFLKELGKWFYVDGTVRDES